MWIQAYLYKLLLCFVLVIVNETSISYALKCDRTPEGIIASRSPSDGRFKLRILGEPDRYIPGENYTSKRVHIYRFTLRNAMILLFVSTVSLEGILRASHGLTHKFTGFFIAAERDNVDSKAPTPKYEDEAVGNFHIVMSAISKFSEKCRNLVTHTSPFPKSDVPVINIVPGVEIDM